MTSPPRAVTAAVSARRPPIGIDDRDFEGYLAQGILLVLGLGQPFHFGATYGDLLALATVPLWAGSVRRFRGAVPLLGLGAITVAWGFVLRDVSAGDHPVNSALGRDTSMQFVSMLLTVAVVLWARRHMSTAAIGISFGLGILGRAVLHPASWADNPWKFAFAVPVALVVLGAAVATGRVAVQLGGALLVAVLSVLLDSRAYSATLALVAILVLWRRLRTEAGGGLTRLRIAALIAAVSGLLYALTTSLLVNGYLGRNAQVRSVEQIQVSGSLILGGRPELAATLKLMEHRLAGYGTGVVPTPNDILIAKSGLAGINYAPNNGYVERYMFGGHFELHSVIGDVWANWGLFGLGFIAVVGYFTVRSIVETVSGGAGDALTIYAAVWTCWNLAFSPFVVSAPILALAVALSLRPRPVPGPVRRVDAGIRRT